jgi:hypothetical protein
MVTLSRCEILRHGEIVIVPEHGSLAALAGHQRLDHAPDLLILSSAAQASCVDGPQPPAAQWF